MTKCELCGKNHDPFSYHKKKAIKLTVQSLVDLGELDKEKAKKILDDWSDSNE